MTTHPAIARIVIGGAFGLALGFLGLPRLEPSSSSAVVQHIAATEVPTPTIVPTPGALLSVGPFNAPLAGWVNDVKGTAWFGGGVYHLYAREPGHFVAAGVPVNQPLHDARLNAEFHKIGGPAGGGYGLIVRDQSTTSARDGHNQSGAYLVAEVGDRGDIGIWQRSENHWIDLVPWTRSEAVHLDRQPNVITLTTHGFALQLQVNGMVVAAVTDDRLPPLGGIGIFVGGDLNEVALDWLRIENTR